MADCDHPPNRSEQNRQHDFRPTASLKTLRLRACLLAFVRNFFDTHGYWEVETPILSRDVVVDAYLEPFVIRDDDDLELFLQTSPEFGMKRLLSSGADAIYQVTRAMRAGEAGRYHNPEFTMIEWYHVGDSYLDQMKFVEEFVLKFLGEAEGLRHGDKSSASNDRQNAQFNTEPPYLRRTYDEAFEAYAGTKVLNLSPGGLADLANSRGLLAPPGLNTDDRDDWLNLLLAELVEPNLGRRRPEFLYDYPASQAALACIRHETPPVAERFELYVRGIEVCNGYHELTDAKELRERMRQQAAIRAAQGRRDLPRHNRLLAAMESGLPPCSGVALGFDRLMMLAVNATSLAEVMAFPFDRA